MWIPVPRIFDTADKRLHVAQCAGENMSSHCEHHQKSHRDVECKFFIRSETDDSTPLQVSP